MRGEIELVIEQAVPARKRAHFPIGEPDVVALDAGARPAQRREKIPQRAEMVRRGGGRDGQGHLHRSLASMRFGVIAQAGGPGEWESTVTRQLAAAGCAAATGDAGADAISATARAGQRASTRCSSVRNRA